MMIRCLILAGSRPLLVAAALLVAACGAIPATAGELWIGAATVDITPEGPVALAGQRRLRIAKTVQSPLKATALVIETRDNDKALDQAVFVCCDLVAIREGIPEAVRQEFKSRLRLPGLDPAKVIISATHTHLAPVTTEQQYTIPKEGVLQPEEYTRFLVGRLSEGAAACWWITPSRWFSADGRARRRAVLFVVGAFAHDKEEAVRL